MYSRLILTILSFFCLSNAAAQTELFQIVDVEVNANGKAMPYAWAGGLNNPQFSSIDLNGDAYEDLFIFDKTGAKVLTFLADSNLNEPTFTYAPQYESIFPKLFSWVLVRDYNCDGVDDLFAHVNQGIQVYKGKRDGSTYTFNLENSLLTFEQNGNPINIWVATDDLPAIDDINGDGDLDILTFGIFGASIEYYECQSIEDANGCDSLTYKAIDFCWGNFQEGGLDNSISFGACKSSSGSTAQNSAQHNAPHAGSTVLSLDNDGDGDKEVILGDVIFPNMVMVINGGDSSNANMVSEDTTFPFYDRSVDMQLFPAGFHLDVNKDGLRDFIAAPNSRTASLNQGNVWYYKNEGTDDSPIFRFQTDSFLVGDMIDVGDVALPTLFDMNGDSLDDLFVGNFGYFVTGLQRPAMAVFSNVGTAYEPSFNLRSTNFQNWGNLNLNGMAPTFGDIDGDGDDDMIIGEQSGALHLFENTAPAGSAASFVLMEPNYFDLDVGQFSTPILHDVSGDGLLDLIVGEQSGNLNYFENLGTANQAIFTDTAGYTNRFGQVDVREPGFITGFSAPHIAALDSGGPEYLFVGCERGFIFQYAIDFNDLLGGTFDTISDFFAGIDVGSRATLTTGDLNNDGELEFLIGSERGGIHMYSETVWDSTTIPLPTSAITKSEETQIRLVPNPASGVFSVQLSSAASGSTKMKIYDHTGRLVLDAADVKNRQSFDVAHLPGGLYHCIFNKNGQNSHQKLVIQ